VREGLTMRTVDGARGEGGGQVLRTALAISLLTGEPVKVENIRAGRKRPGLMRQHLTAVRLATEVGNASVDGAEPGSQELVFRPRAVQGGDYVASVGTAGSATLVLQTVLPALLTARSRSTLVLEGGTHNPLAPPFDFLALAFLPLVNRMGPRIDAELQRPGYYPAGGGRIRVTVEPVSRLSRLELLERGNLQTYGARAVVAGLSPEIAKRELAVLNRRLGWAGDVLKVIQRPDEEGPGNVVMAMLESALVTEVVTGFGEKGRSAESVAEQVATEVQEYLDSNVPVGSHLADQLLILLAMSGSGVFRTLKLSSHARTQIDLLSELSGAVFEVSEEVRGTNVRVGRGASERLAMD
jgi:RNA 3'-terminal phosphate cyclase (ATP)